MFASHNKNDDHDQAAKDESNEVNQKPFLNSLCCPIVGSDPSFEILFIWRKCITLIILYKK